ncbi:hypothetical protein ACIPLR_06005 [Herbaspirillum huttiense]|uniref:hypothetical protein n=1 Tax=Herbaspirillum huttiense TaxID=863372 RepID=UPI003813483B
MPQTITLVEIDRLKSMVVEGRAGDAYTWLASKGYSYSLLARGVVNSDTLSGVAALTFMNYQAVQQSGKTLSRDQEISIKSEMAYAYLDQLSRTADSAGRVNRDVDYKEAWSFHSSVFRSKSLLPSTWTLDTPLSIIEKNGGPAAAQKYWESLLKRGQDPVAGTIVGPNVSKRRQGHQVGTA